MSYPVFTAALLTTALAAAPVLAAERTYDFKGFTNVSVARGIEVTLTTGQDYKVQADVSRRPLLRRLEIRKRGNTLQISRDTRWSFFMMGMADHYHVTVSMPELDVVKASSGADVNGVLGDGGDLEVSASSGAHITLKNLDVAALEASASSGSDITLEGVCEKAEMDVSSGAGIDGEDLTCAAADLQASSGGDIELAVTDRLIGQVSSGGDIDVKGTPKVLSLHESSGGDLDLSD